MIENPSEKDEIYLANVEKIGNSIENICYIENLLSKEDHETLLDYVNSFDSWQEEPWQAKSIKFADMSEEISSILQKVFTLTYLKAKSVYNVKINVFEKNSFQIVKFIDGFSLEPHVDTLSAESNHIASVYYINDDYEGGEINFTDHSLSIKPKANSLIIFPGNENYKHQVFSVIGNPRYSSAMWFQFTGSSFSKKSEWYD